MSVVCGETHSNMRLVTTRGNPLLVYTARHVLPVSHAPIESGAVAIAEGRIAAVGRKADVIRTAGGSAVVRDLGDAVLLPGLVNAHAHLELSWCAGKTPDGDDFAGWIRRLVAARRSVAIETALAAAEDAVRFVVARGCAAVGDLANEDWIAAIVARSPLHAVLFRELLGFRAADARRLLDGAQDGVERMAADAQVRSAGARLRLTPTPHAIYSTSPALLKALAQRARETAAPLSIHVAESPAESELMLRGTGPLAELLRDLGAWDEDWRPPGVSPVRALDRLGVLSQRTLAVHCVQVDRSDLQLLRERGVTVVTCPRSNARLRVGRAPIPAIAAEGIRVAIGTDSLASAPDLDLFAEMAALRADHPALAPDAVLRMATLHGAAALGLERELGSLQAGKLAALVCVRLDSADDDPLEAVTRLPADVERI